ncbi:MAG: 30S ribosomal protein S6 [Planctomycetota bacterium]|nr:30S ribosomal protein S6 [Planctomycetota bacterium]
MAEQERTKAAEKSSDKGAEGEAKAAAPAPAPVVEIPKGHRLYECMWVVDVNAGRENFGKIVDGIKEIVEKSGAHWVNGDKWEERRLAYTIKKRKRGLYILSHFHSEPGNVGKLERNIQISDLVMRALILGDEDGVTLTPETLTSADEDPRGGRRFFGGGGGGGGGGYGGGGGGGGYGGGGGGGRDRGGPRGRR